MSGTCLLRARQVEQRCQKAHLFPLSNMGIAEGTKAIAGAGAHRDGTCNSHD